MLRVQIALVLWGMDHVYDLTALSDEELLARSVKSRDEAEDVVQEAFIRIYRFAPKFDGESGTFRAWAVTILMNVARTRYQKQATARGRFAPLTPEHYESLAAPSPKDAAYAKDAIERALLRAP